MIQRLGRTKVSELPIESLELEEIADACAKARHCVLLAIAACQVADCAPDDLQQRVFARHAILFAYSSEGWLQRWRNALAREKTSSKAAARARSPLREFSTRLDGLRPVRHYLAAKRKPAAESRSDDINATLHTWSQIIPRNVRPLVASLIGSFDAINRIETPNAVSIREGIEIPIDARRSAWRSLPERSANSAYLSGDTGAPLRQQTVVVFQGGEVGRRIAEINDIAIHLDAVLRVTASLQSVEPHVTYIKTALVVELSALLDLVIPPPEGDAERVEKSFADIVGEVWPGSERHELLRLQGSIGADGRSYIRKLRNWLGAHADEDLPMSELREHLDQLKHQNFIDVAEHVLNWLDAIGTNHLGLKGLLLNERELATKYTDDLGRRTLPDPLDVPDLASIFEDFDTELMTVASGPMGSAFASGVMSSRTYQPRKPVVLDKQTVETVAV